MFKKLKDNIYRFWFFLRWRRISRLRLAFYNTLIVKFYLGKTKKEKGVQGQFVNQLKDFRRQRTQFLQQAQEIIAPYVGDICAKCKGACCFGSHERFSPVDFLFISFAKGKINYRLFSISHLILNFLKRFKQPSYRSYKTEPKKCPYLGPSGCRLSYLERPLVCTLFLCKSFINAMDIKNLKKLSKVFKKIEILMKKITFIAIKI